MSIKIVTDSACDLSIEYVKKNNIEVLPLLVNINGEFIKDDLGQTISYNEFYKLIRDGAMPSTTQVNVGAFMEVFKESIKKSEDILYIGLSSALSGTYNSSVKAKEIILEDYKNANIYTIDSLSVSVGEGLLVYKAVELAKEGKDISTIVNEIEKIKKKVIHSIIVDDLNHLKRGGRVSGAVAAVGSLLNIKPSLKIDDEGKVVAGEKIKGRKRAIKYLLNEVKEKAVNIEDQVIFICNADCLEDAEDLKTMILQEIKPKDIIINNIGSVIGSHGGPGTLATVFIGDKR
ncbi:DegV family protein [Clostridium sp.]|uniref:DegV family protein n=1 Tax=Clostridium sp. TaxID=1506 RepID=UPI0026236C1E|nr:DegV family protein [Clostridium sp.]